ncbi:MAG TPA: 3-phosphoshikimate 1-carboxyvinyltransferase [Terriglobia bacterium]|nr:3-phosphoshikimate 1-carboxyvinyltransferase [Terriglobia bacterium]
MEPTTLTNTASITAARALTGTARMPGDKSISHRYAMLAALAEGTSEINFFSPSADCASTLACLGKLGVGIEHSTPTSGEPTSVVTVHGLGMSGLRAPTSDLDAGNSGSTIRMLSGILAAQPFLSVLVGDASLSRRPMQRVIDPLTRMGARFRSADGGRPPLEIEGGSLRAIRYELPVASAQVKSAVLLAGLFADGVTEVIEPAATRDHSEIAIEYLGAEVERQGRSTRVHGGARLKAQKLYVPGDFSSAAFFIAGALALPESNLVIQNVGLNPTRTALLDVLVPMGGRIKVLNLEMVNGEMIGDLHLEGSVLEGGQVPLEAVPGLIDELPMLAVLGTRMQQGLSFHGAAELRVKESDRLRAVAENLRRMGAEVEEWPDGLRVPGQQLLHGAEIDSFSDHRIAMAFAIGGLFADGPTTIRGSDCVEISFPGFFETLAGHLE